MISDGGKNLIFLFSLPRSGSTLLSLMLGTHSKVLAPPEPWFLLKLMRLNDYGNAASPFDDDMATASTRQFLENSTFIESSRAFAITAYNQYLQSTGKTVFLDKTPRYYHILGFIDQLFPEAKKIWLKRNPMDVAASYKTTWHVGMDVIAGQHITFHTFDFSSGLFELAAYFHEQDANKYEIRYEDLVNAPRESMSGLCSFLGLSYEENVLNYLQNSNTVAQYKASAFGDKKIFSTSSIHADSINTWQSVFSISDIDLLTRMTGLDIYHRIGYGSVAEEIRTYTQQRVDETTATDIRVKLNSAKHDKISELRSQLALSEADRAARLEAIHELQKQRDADKLTFEKRLEADWVSFENRLHADHLRYENQLQAERLRMEELLESSVVDLAKNEELLALAQERVAILESDKSQKEDLIAGLIQQKNYLESFDGALQVVVVKILKKIHLYRFMQRHKHFIKKAYSGLRGISAPAKPEIKTTIAEPEMSINSPVVDALMVARCLPGDTDDQTLVDMYMMGASLRKGKKALCILPDENTAQIAYVISRSGVEVTCLDRRQKITYAPIYKFPIIHEDFNVWLDRVGAAAMTDYGCLLIGYIDGDDDLIALKGALFSETVVVVNDQRSAEQMIKLGWGKPDRLCGRFGIYDKPARDWINIKTAR